MITMLPSGEHNMEEPTAAMLSRTRAVLVVLKKSSADLGRPICVILSKSCDESAHDLSPMTFPGGVTPSHTSMNQVQILTKHQLGLVDRVPAFRPGQEDPIPYVKTADPRNVNPYRVRSCVCSA